MHSTLQERLQLEKMRMCSCKRDRAIYFCDNSQCINRESQCYYCDECAEESEGRHPHAPKKIVRETYLHQQEWSKLREEVRKVLDISNDKFHHYGSVIRYLEKACIKMPAI
jgi:hypothetical protein